MNELESRPTRPTRAKHGGKKQSVESRLLDAMERLIAQGHEFRDISVEQLATEAGIARATFYLHFRDKGEFVARVMVLLTEEVVRSNGEWLQGGSDFSPASVFKAVSGTIKTFKKHQAIVAAINDTVPYDEVVAAQYAKMMDSIKAQSRRSFAAVRKAGTGKPTATDEVSDILTWTVMVYAARHVNRSSGAELTRLAKNLAYICSSAIFLDPAS